MNKIFFTLMIMAVAFLVVGCASATDLDDASNGHAMTSGTEGHVASFYDDMNMTIKTGNRTIFDELFPVSPLPWDNRHDELQ